MTIIATVPFLLRTHEIAYAGHVDSKQNAKDKDHGILQLYVKEIMKQNKQYAYTEEIEGEESLPSVVQELAHRKKWVPYFINVREVLGPEIH